MTDKTLLDFLPEIEEKLKAQMESDQKRWGDTWKYRPAYGQELRVLARYNDYFDQWKRAGTPVPWLKIMGEALICLVREAHPEEHIEEPKGE
jgi:hypothetical protein